MMFILRNSSRCRTPRDWRSAAVVQKSWANGWQPPQKSLFGEPPPDEEQHEEWRLPPAINQDTWNEETWEDLETVTSSGHTQICSSLKDLNPQDGSRASLLCPVNLQKPLKKQYFSDKFKVHKFINLWGFLNNHFVLLVWSPDLGIVRSNSFLQTSSPAVKTSHIFAVKYMLGVNRAPTHPPAGQRWNKHKTFSKRLCMTSWC